MAQQLRTLAVFAEDLGSVQIHTCLLVTVVMTKHFLGRCNTRVYSPRDREPMTDQSTHTTQVQLGVKQGVLSGFLTGMWVRGSYRSRHDSKAAASPRPAPAWVTAQKPGAHCTASDSSALRRLSFPRDSALTSSRQLSWFLLLPGRWAASPCLFLPLSFSGSSW